MHGGNSVEARYRLHGQGFEPDLFTSKQAVVFFFCLLLPFFDLVLKDLNNVQAIFKTNIKHC